MGTNRVWYNLHPTWNFLLSIENNIYVYINIYIEVKKLTSVNMRISAVEIRIVEVSGTSRWINIGSACNEETKKPET